MDVADEDVGVEEGAELGEVDRHEVGPHEVYHREAVEVVVPVGVVGECVREEGEEGWFLALDEVMDLVGHDVGAFEPFPSQLSS